MRTRLRFALVFAVAIALSATIQAQTYKVLHSFTGANGDGAVPLGTLVQVGSDFYGTTRAGGDTSFCTGGCGTIFKLDSSGNVTTVYSFDASTDDGLTPIAGLALATDGNLYGTTPNGGATANGAVYRFDPSNGTETTIHSLDRDTGGWYAATPAIQGTDGKLYVVTTYGHCDGGTDDCAQVLQMTTSGSTTPLHTFDPNTEGAQPLSPLLQTSSADFYGATSGGNGTVFHMNAAGEITTVHAFQEDGSDGRVAIGHLVSDGSGNLYGVTEFGGASNQGTIFRVDVNGQYASIYTFDGTAGANPASGLIRASDGFFYGVTEGGGAFGFGTLYRMDSNAQVVSLHDFDGTDNDLGASPHSPAGSLIPFAALVEGSDGNLYGVRWKGGTAGFVFRYSTAPPAPLYCPNSFVRRDQMAVFLLKTEHGAAHIPPLCAGIFADVACPGLFADWIEELASEGITGGCSAGNYCPLSPVTRGQMAVFLLKTEHGAAHTPPPCTGVFPDVPCGSQFADWIEELAAEGITSGCGGGNYCPTNPVTRAQMAVFLLKIEHGSAYTPPACVPLFGDVLCPSLFADWIEELYNEGITAGCSGS